MRFTWKIGGEAGFGIMTTGLVFSRIANRLGYYTFDYPQYPSLIRGGHNTIDTVVSDTEVFSLKNTIDFLVCLNKETFILHKDKLTKDSYILFDPDDFNPEGDYVKVAVPFGQILKKLQAQVVMKNTVALGASLAILGSDLKILFEIIEQQFAKKGDQVVEHNKKFAEEGFNHVKIAYSSLIKPYLVGRTSEQKLVLSGNDAFSLGSVLADCRFYAAYPMTPSSSVLTTLAGWQEKTGMIVRHTEDEISAINTSLGASFAGVRASVGTSGGGFSLMVESLSFAGIAEMPIVVFLAQRPGPATGMPTWTEQGDLLFTVHAGHGEFPKIVLAPGDIYEMIELTAKAYNLADIYQTPVIILSDMLLSESHKSLLASSLKTIQEAYATKRGKVVSKSSAEKYLRYQITEDGISERLIPGYPGSFYQDNSYEHLEDGHTTEESQPRIDQVNKRNRKLQTYLNSDYKGPTVYGDLNTSEIVFVSWGSMKGILIEAQKLLLERGIATSLMHFSHMHPLSEKALRPLFVPSKRYVLVENNSLGQFGKLLREETGIEIQDTLLKYDGRPFWPEEIVNKVL